MLLVLFKVRIIKGNNNNNFIMNFVYGLKKELEETK